MIKKECDLVGLINVLGKKWSFRILSSFLLSRKHTYNEIYNIYARQINPTLLSNRLKEFQKFKLIYREDNNYCLTVFGELILEQINEIKEVMSLYKLKIPDFCKVKSCVCQEYSGFISEKD